MKKFFFIAYTQFRKLKIKLFDKELNILRQKHDFGEKIFQRRGLLNFHQRDQLLILFFQFKYRKTESELGHVEIFDKIKYDFNSYRSTQIHKNGFK
jgi:hypothetical protein